MRDRVCGRCHSLTVLYVKEYGATGRYCLACGYTQPVWMDGWPKKAIVGEMRGDTNLPAARSGTRLA